MAKSARKSADAAAQGPSLDPEEIEKFTAMAAEWWDPEGKFKPLHRLNPTRLGFIRDRVAAHFGREPLSGRPLDGLSVLDIGCGGGLLAEPLTRLGAAVTGIDAAEQNLEIASLHAAESGLEIDYRHATAEQLADAGERFDVVLNMEVVEHVADLPLFMSQCAQLVKADGIMFVATLNRNLLSWLFAIVGAEYVLGWLPRGTHSWRKFVRPRELQRLFANNGLALQDCTGVKINPFNRRFSLSPLPLVNYMVSAKRNEAGGIAS